MQLPPIHLLSALPYVVTCGSVPYLCTSQLYYGLGQCARHSPFGRTDPYYTVILYSSCGLNKRPAATLAFPLSVSVLSSQYLFQRGPIWIVAELYKILYLLRLDDSAIWVLCRQLSYLRQGLTSGFLLRLRPGIIRPHFQKMFALPTHDIINPFARS